MATKPSTRFQNSVAAAAWPAPKSASAARSTWLARSGRSKDYLVIDTQSLNWAPYHRFLHQKSPDKWPKLVGDNDQGGINPLGILGVLNILSQSNNICYLNPSFGYYFEIFYQEPHGLVYPLKKLPEDTLLPPPLPKNLIAENQQFWDVATEQVFPRLKKALLAGNPQAHMNLPPAVGTIVCWGSCQPSCSAISKP